ncbi:MAG: hypothetical protein L6R40_005758 [Gallowayella cf. fulva]|nr:MAG: hypothetical protein L6R40_005758 [Xanthomendoza cf. fulva]
MLQNQGWEVDPVGRTSPPIEGAASVVPHSKLQHIDAAAPIDLLRLGQLNLNTFAQLKRGPGVKTFVLKSFYFGIGTDTGTIEGLAQGGTIAVTRFDVKGKQVPTVSLSYVLKGSQNQPLKLAVLPGSYQNLANVSIGVATSAPVTERTYIALDDVRHVNYT